MQYHLNGFVSGSPDLKQLAADPSAATNDVDVLIVGCGPAGLTLAAQLAAFADIRTCIIDQKPGPLEIGQADGIACRSMEMFEAFGFADKVAREGYWVNETTFWRPKAGRPGISRTGRIKDVEDGLSEQPHVILSQARVHDFLLEVMEASPHRLVPRYDRQLRTIARDEAQDYPITATIDCANGAPEIIRAKYLVGCDGARSTVRKELGYTLKGVSARQLWGVMDVLAVTDFPDIRLKSAIQSASQGSILIIPREGGYLVRMYIELDELAPDERASDRTVTPKILIRKAQAILSPYQLDVREVAWWSAYEIGQRVCDRFDDAPAADQSPRIFIAGDACHTHSPKAGQGMNVSMADAFNLGWKLASVIRGHAGEDLLRTYSAERQAKAQELIDFDREMAHRFSTAPKDAGSSDMFQTYFSKHARYTAGVETRYASSLIVGGTENQMLAQGFEIGTRFHSAPVIRLADAKPLHLGHVLKADGRWRIILFAGATDRGRVDEPMAAFMTWLSQDPGSPIVRYLTQGSESDAMVDVRAVFQCGHRELEMSEMAGSLFPSKGRYGLTDYEKVFCADPRAGDIFDLRQVDRESGAIVVVRPDQYVSAVYPLGDREAVANFFAPFM